MGKGWGGGGTHGLIEYCLRNGEWVRGRRIEVGLLKFVEFERLRGKLTHWGKVVGGRGELGPIGGVRQEV